MTLLLGTCTLEQSQTTFYLVLSREHEDAWQMKSTSSVLYQKSGYHKEKFIELLIEG